MLKIRLQRVGRVNIPTFRLVLTDSKNSTKSGKFLEVLGTYDPVKNVKEVNGDRVKHWMGHGAKLSDTVHNWLIDKKVIPGKKVNALPKRTAPKKEAPAPVAEAPKAEAPKADAPAAPEAAPAEAPVEAPKA
ncbi:MAG: 30S ribosomal protein S16 [bacterium]|nr:30S ribosomal protein S16 [bacterium]